MSALSQSKKNCTISTASFSTSVSSCLDAAPVIYLTSKNMGSCVDIMNGMEEGVTNLQEVLWVVSQDICLVKESQQVTFWWISKIKSHWIPCWLVLCPVNILISIIKTALIKYYCPDQTLCDMSAVLVNFYKLESFTVAGTVTNIQLSYLYLNDILPIISL